MLDAVDAVVDGVGVPTLDSMVEFYGRFFGSPLPLYSGPVLPVCKHPSAWMLAVSVACRPIGRG
jgi:hypothetical protein